MMSGAEVFRRRRWLGLVPLAAVCGAYFAFAYWYAAGVPNSRIFPTAATFWEGLRWTLEPVPVRGGRPLLVDTAASLERLASALAAAGALALLLMLAVERSVRLRALLLPSIVVLAKLPMVALLPLMLVWLGPGELAKFVLVVAEILPAMALQLVEESDRHEQMLHGKLMTLALPTWQEIVFVRLGMILPFFLLAVQSALGPAWLYLLVGETFGTDAGLGYRIFLLRARLWMDITIIYVVWISLLAVGSYYGIEWIRRRTQWTWS